METVIVVNVEGGGVCKLSEMEASELGLSTMPSAFRTTSTEAVLVVAGMITVDIQDI